MNCGAPASLAYAYGEEDRVVAATRGAGIMGLNFGTLMGLGAILDGGHRVHPAHAKDLVPGGATPAPAPAAGAVGSIAP